jgi:integrase
LRNLVVEYLKQDPRNGNWLYRRRVPKVLKELVKKTEFVQTLGRTKQDALVNYGPTHQKIEHLKALAERGYQELSPAETREGMIALLEEWGADPFSGGRDENERTWREVEAERLVGPYQDDLTGEYDEVPKDKDELASALLVGVSEDRPEPTITDAFKFYLKENLKGTAEKQKKDTQRLRRAERDLLAAVGSDKFLSQLKREDARKWRDMRLSANVSPATVRREKNTICAVINLARSELDASGENPFSQLKLPKSETGRQNQREALPQDVIDGVYKALGEGPQDLLAIWALLDHTGARPSEISELLRSEVILNHSIPHIVIRERDDRSLKTTWSNREVPLVGPALETAKGLLQGAGEGSAPLFPRFQGDGGMDRLSKALTKRIRVFTRDKKHVPYSLRHNMKDRLRAAEVFEATQRALLGHSYGAGEAASYGGAVSLEKKKEALRRTL